jgi:hypothetical protein
MRRGRMLAGGPEPFAYIVAHGLKILGGAVGGTIAAGCRRPSEAPTAAAASASPGR